MNEAQGFKEFMAGHNASYRRAMEKNAVKSWEDFQRLAEKDDFSLLEMEGIGRNVLYSIRETAHERGFGPKPLDWPDFYRVLDEGPVLAGFGPIKKLGLHKRVRQLLKDVKAKSWDDVKRMTNRELFHWTGDSTIWDLRHAQFLAGQGPDPGPQPRYVKDFVRFLAGGRADQPLPPLTAEDWDKISLINAQGRAIIDEVNERVTRLKELGMEVVKIARGHVEDDSQVAELRSRCSMFHSIYLMSIRLGGELTGFD